MKPDIDIIARRSVIIIENDSIGDGWFSPLVAQSLREYADMIDRHEAGHSSIEVHESQNGNRLTILSGTWIGEYLPQPRRFALR